MIYRHMYTLHYCLNSRRLKIPKMPISKELIQEYHGLTKLWNNHMMEYYIAVKNEHRNYELVWKDFQG